MTGDAERQGREPPRTGAPTPQNPVRSPTLRLYTNLHNHPVTFQISKTPPITY